MVRYVGYSFVGNFKYENL